MMRPVKSRNGNNIKASGRSCSGEERRGRFPPRPVGRRSPAAEMNRGIHALLCVMVALSGSSQRGGQSHALPSAGGPGTWTSPGQVEDPRNQPTQTPAGTAETAAPTGATWRQGTVHADLSSGPGAGAHLLASSPTAGTSQRTHGPAVPTAGLGTPPLPAAADRPSNAPPTHSPPTQAGFLASSESLATFSSQAGHTAPHSVSTATRPSTAPPQPPAAPTHRGLPSELNVGDEDLKGSHHHSSSPLDPLLAGLLSVFIVTTAVVFVVLFLKLRQRTNHPEFHRLQDLPMDDLMEDTPLSRYSY